MAQSPGFDMSKLSTATKILVPALVLFILLTAVIPLNRVCTGGETIGNIVNPRICVGIFGLWTGLGIVAGLFAVALLALEVMRALNVNVGIPPKTQGLLALGLGGGVVLFTLLRILIKPLGTQLNAIGALVAAVLALAIGYGAYMRYQEPAIGLPEPGLPGPGAPPPGPGALPPGPPPGPPPPPPAGGGGGFTS
ncbi:MAG: hypothetical protein WD770_03155 [Actinomycetota bacterium]